MTLEERFAELTRLRAAAELGGGPERIARQHAAGKRTARERVAALVDKGSFEELDRFVVHPTGDPEHRVFGDGVVTGSARINGRPIYLFAQDFTVFGGRKPRSSRIPSRHASSLSAAKCATPERRACVSAPPSSSNVTSSWVTALSTSGPVTNM